MEAVLDNRNFLYELQESKKNTYDELKEKLNSAILACTKEFLKTQNIKVNDNITDLKQLNKIIKKQNPDILETLKKYEDSLNEDLNDIIENLKDGSENAFQKFGSLLKTVATTGITGMGVATLTTISGLRIPRAVISSALITTPVVYKGVKGYIKQKKANKEKALDITLLNLAKTEEIASNNNSQIKIDIPPQVMQMVKEQFASNNINIDTKDSVIFLSNILELDYKNKEKAVQLINALTGSRIDVNTELKKAEKSITQIANGVKNNLISPIVSGGLAGLKIAGVANDIAGDEVASTLTGLGTTALSGSVQIGVLAGGGQYALSKWGSMIPAVGGYIEQATSAVNSAENYLFGTTSGMLISGVATGAVLLYKGVKGLIQSKKRKLEEQKDTKVLKESIMERIDKSKKDVNAELEKRTDKQVMLDIVCDELRKNGVDVPRNLDNASQLKTLIKTESLKVKTNILSITKQLQQIQKENTETFKDKIKNYAKYAYFGGMLALAGLGAYDMFLNPGFLKEIRYKSDDLQKNIESNRKLLGEQLQQSNEDINTAVSNDMDLSYSNAYSNEIRLKEFGIENVPENMKEELIANGINADFSKYYLSPDVQGWMSNNGYMNAEQAIQAIKSTPISDEVLMETVKEKSEILYDVLDKSSRRGWLEQLRGVKDHIDWSNVDVSSEEVKKEIERLHINTSTNRSVIDQLKEWVSKFDNDSLRIKSIEDIPPEIYFLKDSGNLTDKEWDKVFHTETLKQLDELNGGKYQKIEGYDKIAAFQKDWQKTPNFIDKGTLEENLGTGRIELTDDEMRILKGEQTGGKGDVSTLFKGREDEISETIRKSLENEKFKHYIDIVKTEYQTDISKNFTDALETINAIETAENAKAYVDSMPVILKNPEAFFGLGAVITGAVKGFSTGVKKVFNKISRKDVKMLPEASSSENVSKKSSMPEIVVDIQPKISAESQNKQKNNEISVQENKNRDEK